MKSNYTHIAIVLDRSGSMESVKGDTIGGFNSFLEDQRSGAGEATLSLVQFDNEYEIIADCAPINSVKALTDRTYLPRGSTALLDAIGRTIVATGARLSALPEEERPAHVVFAILTDGMENASNEFSRSRIFEMISHQRDVYRWEFVFIGANQDAIATGADLGIAAGNSIAYAATPMGQRDIMEKLSRNIGRRRMGVAYSAEGVSCVESDAFFTEEDRATLPNLTGKSA